MQDFVCTFAEVLLSNTNRMNHIGYINQSQLYDIPKDVIDTMKQSGCSIIHMEQPKDKARPEWAAFIDSLSSGDSAVLHSFDNAFCNFHDMMFFLKYCSKMGIRIISLSDGLDTQDQLFPEKKTSDTLKLICRVFGKRDKVSPNDLEAELYSNTYADRKLKRYGLVINMYKAGYSVKEIMQRTGYRGKSNIYRVLHRYGVRMDYPTKSNSKGKPIDVAI